MMDHFIQLLRQDGSYKGQIEHVEVISPKNPQYGKLTRPLSKKLQEYLDRYQILLYSHQTDAINKIRLGKNVVIATSTASGKTLAFTIPVFDALINDNSATALYLYPTKALANDQLKVLKEMEHNLQLSIAPNIYDGDTEIHKRPRIRQGSRIILSNPYGFHLYLPWHHKWKRFLQNLRFLIIDEAHMYRGVFGSNVAMLIRRLLRICARYGSTPQIILSSATIANPKEHSQKLTGKPFEIVTNDGSARGKKYFIFWNPPFIDTGKLTRRSTHQETKDLFVFNVINALQTLCFTISRQMTELITRWAREAFEERSPQLSQAITAYRAGYLPTERRAIEEKLRTKKLLGVVSTNALELGIDIGSLDSVIISGYPGTIISTWQQAGRAGRTIADSIATLVAFQNPLDQYFMKHPEDFFGRSPEHAIIDLGNPYIVTGHLLCAAAELPLTLTDKHYFPELFEESLAALEQQTLVRQTPKGWVYSGRFRPVEIINLNNISDKTVTVISEGEILETMDLTKAYSEAHDGAVLLHQGETYVIEDLDLTTLTARASKLDVDYYTDPRKTVDFTIENISETKQIGISVSLGEVEVTEYYHAYVLKTYDEVIGQRPLNLPPLNFSTVSMWFTISEDIGQIITEQGLDFAGGLHAIEHAMIAMAPLYAMCDRWDIGGVSTILHYDTGGPTISIYDGYEGGIGISEKLYEVIESLFSTTLRLIYDCECEIGCPSCIYSPKCGNENEPLDKQAAIIILNELLKEIENTKNK